MVGQNNPKEGEEAMLLYYTSPDALVEYAEKLVDDDTWWEKSIESYQMMPGSNSRQPKEFIRNRLREILAEIRN